METPEKERNERLAELDKMIFEKEEYISHYRNRLEEYEKYALENW